MKLELETIARRLAIRVYGEAHVDDVEFASRFLEEVQKLQKLSIGRVDERGNYSGDISDAPFDVFRIPFSGVIVTDEMVTAYLEANDNYWLEEDKLPPNPSKWRNGTPRQATEVSLKAVFSLFEQRNGGQASAKSREPGC